MSKEFLWVPTSLYFFNCLLNARQGIPVQIPLQLAKISVDKSPKLYAASPRVFSWGYKTGCLDSGGHCWWSSYSTSCCMCFCPERGLLNVPSTSPALGCGVPGLHGYETAWNWVSGYPMAAEYQPLAGCYKPVVSFSTHHSWIREIFCSSQVTKPEK